MSVFGLAGPQKYIIHRLLMCCVTISKQFVNNGFTISYIGLNSRNSSLPQKYLHFLFKREAGVHHCTVSSINSTSSGVLSLPLKKKGSLHVIPMLC